MTTPFANLLAASREIYALRSAQGLLGWDQETMMPPRAGESRAEAIAALATVIQERYCAPRLGELLEAGAIEPELGPDAAAEAQAVIRELKRDRDRLLKIPPALTAEMARTCSLAQQAWTKARPRDDTAAFNPWLDKIVALKRQEADCLGWKTTRYEALLDHYEPGASPAAIEEMFNELKRELKPLLQSLTGRLAKSLTATLLLAQQLPLEAQKAFCREMLGAIGFDLEAGRLDESAHPFTEGLTPTDVRLTTRYRADGLADALSSALHEGGHGIYEQGYRPEWIGTPMAEAVSLGIHESQSRTWENQVGRSLPFWKFALPALRRHFPGRFDGATSEALCASLNQVRPSLIRVEADEVTYNLHVALRFDLERQLIDGGMKAAEVEAAWNEKMEELLGLRPDRPANGYLQDVHWSVGLIGYFPTYTLGNLYSAQLFAAARRDLPELDAQITAGEFLPLRDWLREKIHRHGRCFRPAELIERATGEKPSARAWLEYVKGKFPGP